MKTEFGCSMSGEQELAGAKIPFESKDIAKKAERIIPKEFFDDSSNKFLYDTAISELSSLELTAEKEKYINIFLNLLTNPPREKKEKEKYEDESLVDQEATENLISRLDSLLKDARKEIGIPPGEEKPFSIKVLKLKSDDYFDQEDEWQELTGGAPSMIANRDLSIDNEPRNSTIYLSRAQAEKMFNDNGWEDFKVAYFLHEYRHTQRAFSFAGSRLYRFIDEVCTNKAGYRELTAVLSILCSSTDDLKFGDFFEAYETGDKNLKAKCLSKFKENFGGFGLMLLGGKKSSAHSGDDDGIEGQPYEKKYENENLSFLETLLIFLDKNTKGKWLEALSNNIRNTENFSRQNLEAVRKHGLSNFCQGVEDTDAEMTKKIFTLLDEEIETRKNNKEQGLGE